MAPMNGMRRLRGHEDVAGTDCRRPPGHSPRDASSWRNPCRSSRSRGIGAPQEGLPCQPSPVPSRRPLRPAGRLGPRALKRSCASLAQADLQGSADHPIRLPASAGTAARSQAAFCPRAARSSPKASARHQASVRRAQVRRLGAGGRHQCGRPLAGHQARYRPITLALRLQRWPLGRHWHGGAPNGQPQQRGHDTAHRHRPAPAQAGTRHIRQAGAGPGPQRPGPPRHPAHSAPARPGPSASCAAAPGAAPAGRPPHPAWRQPPAAGKPPAPPWAGSSPARRRSAAPVPTACPTARPPAGR